MLLAISKASSTRSGWSRDDSRRVRPGWSRALPKHFRASKLRFRIREGRVLPLGRGSLRRVLGQDDRLQGKL